MIEKFSEVKMEYPACGALGGSRECNSLPQTATCCREELKI